MRGNVALFVPHAGCPHRCSFCNQNSITGKTEILQPLEAAATAKKALCEMGNDAKYSQIAFFGGSFTAVERGYMISLLEAVEPYVGENGFSGIRVSTRPDAIDGEILDILKKYGVRAIELGAQSMDDDVLKKNLRGHTVNDVVNASNLIKQYGFELGLQMMTGLYASTAESDYLSAQKIAKLCPDTVRIYPTIVLPDTLLARLYNEKKYLPPTLDDTVELCSDLMTFFAEKGIRVIKVGLHSSQEVAQNRLAGPYHPAFRELCESKIYLKNVESQLNSVKGSLKERELQIFVRPDCISKMTGQKKSNIKSLNNSVKSCRVFPDGNLAEYETRIVLN